MHNEVLGLRADMTLPSSAKSAHTCPEWVDWAEWTLPAWLAYITTSALLAGACAILVRHYAPYAAGSGISEIKCVLAGFSIRGFLSAKTLLIKSLGLPLAIASGLSVGKEGPAVHVACCIGHTAAKVLRWLVPSHSKLRELLTASSAAGVAVAFGSPVGGVLFALEVRHRIAIGRTHNSGNDVPLSTPYDVANLSMCIGQYSGSVGALPGLSASGQHTRANPI